MEEDGSQTGLLGKQLLGTVGVLGGMVSDEITIAIHDPRSRSTRASGPSTILTVELSLPAWRPRCMYTLPAI